MKRSICSAFFSCQEKPAANSVQHLAHYFIRDCVIHCFSFVILNGYVDGIIVWIECCSSVIKVAELPNVQKQRMPVQWFCTDERGMTAVLMDETKSLLSWLLVCTLEEHFMGNKSRMASAFGIHRHTIWRAFRIIDGKQKGVIGPLIGQQLFCWYAQHNHSLDAVIRNYVEQRSKNNAKKCSNVRKWIQEVRSGSVEINPREMIEVVERILPELQTMLSCSFDQRRDDVVTFCRCDYVGDCPILALIDITRKEGDRLKHTESNKVQEVTKAT